MPRRIVIIVGHPDPAPARLCRALAAAYADGARIAGHAVHLVDIALLDFPLLRTAEAFGSQPAPETLKDAVMAIEGADHVVIVFPLWLGAMPAMLKAFLEQVMRPGVAFAYPQPDESGFARALLKGKSARVVVTMGMPALAYRFWYLAHGVAGLRRNILNFVGISPVRTTLFGMVDTASQSTRERWFSKMHVLGVRAG